MALVRAVATVHLVGLGPGNPVWVDEDDAQIARWLRGGQLKRIDSQAEPEAPTDAVVISVSPPQPAVKAKRAPAKEVPR